MTFKIGLLGFGVVGTGTAKILLDPFVRHPVLKEITIGRVGVRSLDKPREIELSSHLLTTDLESIITDPEIATFATLDTGEKIEAPKPLKKRLKRLKKTQKNLSRKQKRSKRLEKARKRVAKIQAKIKDTRTDFLHKLSTRIVRENQTIVLGDLNTSGMVKNRKLSRAISDLGWRSFRDMLSAKSDKYGRNFRTISRWEPRSQR